MSTYQKIKENKIKAMKDGNTLARNILGMVISSAQALAKEEKMEVPSDAQVVSSLKKIIKGNRDLLESVPNNEEAKEEIRILEEYLPKQLSDQEIKNIVFDFISNNMQVNKDNKSVGAIMKHLSSNYFGKFDGKSANLIVRQMLENG